MPGIAGLRFQTVHSRDVGRAYRLAIVSDVRGAFNVAAEPVLDPTTMAEALGAKVVPLSARGCRVSPTCPGDKRSVPLDRTPHTRGRLRVAGP